MATRLSIAEQIQLQYKRALGLKDDVKNSVDRRELFPLINQVANELLATVIQGGFKSGGLQIPSGTLATYGNCEVLSENGRYFVNIPVYPISLPRNIGVYSIVPQTGTPLIDGTPYIPITQEDWDLLSIADINNSGMLEGQTAFYVEGKKAFFTKQPSSVVKIKLVISDPSLIGDSDPYPVTPEIESALIERIVNMLKSNTAGQIHPNPQDR